MSKASIRFLAVIAIAVTPPTHSSAESIELVREVSIEIGKSILPTSMSITRVPGGYVLTGMASFSFGWVVKTDEAGNVLWRYTDPGNASVKLRVQAPTFNGAAPIPDGSVLVCGYTTPKDQRPRRVGLILILDKNGQLVRQQVLHPNSDESFAPSSLNWCIPWGDGAAVLGDTHRARRDLWSGSGIVPREDFFWLLSLDSNGILKWEKLIPRVFGGGAIRQRMSLAALQGGDLVFSTWDTKPPMGATDLVRVDERGEVKTRLELQQLFQVLRSGVSESGIFALGLGKGGPTLLKLTSDFKEIEKVRGGLSSAGSVSRAEYLLSDHSVALFGSQLIDHAHTANIVKLGSDLNAMSEFQFQPRFGAYWVEDAAPTGEPGEFATVRLERLREIGQTSHVILAFVRIR